MKTSRRGFLTTLLASAGAALLGRRSALPAPGAPGAVPDTPPYRSGWIVSSRTARWSEEEFPLAEGQRIIRATILEARNYAISQNRTLYNAKILIRPDGEIEYRT